jgi:putative copper resistance protein D
MIDTVSIILRASGFVALFQAAGMAIYLSLFQSQLDTGLIRAHRRLGTSAAVAALVLVAAHFCMEPARMGGGFASIGDPVMQELALDSPLARALAWRISGLLILLPGLAITAAPGRPLALMGAALVLVSFTQVGHSTTLSPRPVLAGILLLHVAIAAFWFGALLPLRAVAMRGPPENAARIAESFSRIAIWLVPTLFAAGVGMAVLMMRTWEALTAPYGRLLVLKVAIFTLLMALAALNRWRYVPALAAGDALARRAFGRTAMVEFLLISAVLAATAMLTTLYSPGS